MKRLAIITIIVLLFLVTDKSLASWHAGNRRSYAYGVKANIFTPYIPPYMYPSDRTPQSNWVSTAGPYWMQIGWLYYHGWDKPVVYYEYCKYPCLVVEDYSQEWLGDIEWNTNASFRVQNVTSVGKIYGTWCVYKNDILIVCSSNQVAPPVEVQVMSESHHPWNDLNTYFSSVSYLGSNGLWQLFDLSMWYEDYPYTTNKYYPYEFQTQRYDIYQGYLPMVMK